MKVKVKMLASKDDFGMPTDGVIEMVRFKKGLINLGGRSLPF